jgi:hypothetical protein
MNNKQFWFHYKMKCLPFPNYLFRMHASTVNTHVNTIYTSLTTKNRCPIIDRRTEPIEI